MSPTILIFSDTHLTPRPDKRKLRFLLHIIQNADTVIINGDFWDSYLTTAQQFIASPFWQPLFELLKSKEAIYLYGNHDSIAACQGIEKTFSTQQFNVYEFQIKNQRFHLEHGNKIAPETDELSPSFPRLLLAVGSLADNLFTFLGKQLFLKHYQASNEKMKAWQEIHMDKNTYLVCGHSHYAELSTNPPYLNSGSIRGGLASYILLNEGVPELIIEGY